MIHLSVVKAKRKESSFEVFRNIYRLRKAVNNELLFDFGYRRDKAEAKTMKMMGKLPTTKYEDLDDSEKAHFDQLKIRFEAFESWFIQEMKIAILNDLREITSELFMANSIYPTVREELIERRIHQDRALGCCAALQQNLYVVIMELPVDHNKYTRLAKDIDFQIQLIKRWRQSDGRFRQMIQKGEISIGQMPNGVPTYNGEGASMNDVVVYNQEKIDKAKQQFTNADQDDMNQISAIYSGNPFSIADDSTVNIVKDALSGSSIEETQQKGKGMPERVFVRKGSL